MNHQSDLHQAFIEGGYLKEDEKIFALVLKLFLIFGLVSLGIPVGYWLLFH